MAVVMTVLYMAPYLFGHVPKNPHRYAGARERMSPDEISVDVQLPADSSNFVL